METLLSSLYKVRKKNSLEISNPQNYYYFYYIYGLFCIDYGVDTKKVAVIDRN